MIIHFITGGDIYSYNYINYIQKNFDVSNNKFFVYKNKNYNENYTTDYPNLEFYNQEIKFSVKKYIDVVRAERIILHQLNIPKVMLFWAVFYPFIFKKLLWVIWGGDLYDYYDPKITVKEKMIEIVRSYFIKRIRFISSYIKGDYELCKKIYGTKAKYLKSWYPYTINEKVLNLVHSEKIKSPEKVLLVGNSADFRNNHIEILEKLKRFKDHNLKLLIILSYGGSEEYIKRVVDYAVTTFGSKVNCLTEYLKFEDYIQILNSTDICIFNHNRQQGLGNINLMLAIKKKVYLRSVTTPFEYYNSIGIKINDTDTIDKLTWEDFTNVTEEELELNKKLIIEDLDINSINQNWKAIIDGSW